MICRNCGNSLNIGASFCVKCGISTASPPVPAEMPRPKKANSLGLIILAFFLIFMSAGIFLYLHLTDEPQENVYIAEPTEAVAEVPVDTQEPPQETAPPVFLTGPDVFEHNVNAVFTIYVNSGHGYLPNGSGFFISPTGIAVTNHHVMAGWPSAAIYTHDGERFAITGFYSYDTNNDLAVIQVDGRRRGFEYVTISSLDNLRVGEDVFAIGSPRGVYRNSFTSGVLSRMAYEAVEFGVYRVYDMLQFTAPITGGNSGGPLFNNRGEVIGVNTAAYSGMLAQNINFAVRIDRVVFPAADAQLRHLPIGDLLVPWEDHAFFVGTWVWSEGYYVFHEDGTGWRDWIAGPGVFDWRVIDNVLEIRQGAEREAWVVNIIDDFTVNIGGSIFEWIGEPGEVPPASDDMHIAEHIIGAWVWDGGMYTFEFGGLGWRDWDISFGYFEWLVSGGRLITYGADGHEGEWVVGILESGDITIAGHVFERWYDSNCNVSQVLLGEWMWYYGYLSFGTDGIGWRVLHDDMGFIYFLWYVYNGVDLYLFANAFGLIFDYVYVINDMHVIFGGYTLERLG